MPQIFGQRNEMTLFSAEHYPRSNEELQQIGLSGKRNAEIRAMTIAAFRIAQNNSQLSQQLMDSGLLKFLLADSDSALGHWKRKGRLEQVGLVYRLTAGGLTECQNTLLGLSGSYSTTEPVVQQWVDRMIAGDATALRSRRFEQSSWKL